MTDMLKACIALHCQSAQLEVQLEQIELFLRDPTVLRAVTTCRAALTCCHRSTGSHLGSSLTARSSIMMAASRLPHCSSVSPHACTATQEIELAVCAGPPHPRQSMVN